MIPRTSRYRVTQARYIGRRYIISRLCCGVPRQRTAASLCSQRDRCATPAPVSNRASQLRAIPFQVDAFHGEPRTRIIPVEWESKKHALEPSKYVLLPVNYIHLPSRDRLDACKPLLQLVTDDFRSCRQQAGSSGPDACSRENFSP